MNKITLECLVISILGVFINVISMELDYAYDLPLYLNVIGTIVVARECGLFFSILTALTSNIITGTFYEYSVYFSIVNVLVAIMTSMFYYRRRGKEKTDKFFFYVSLSLVTGTVGVLIEWGLAGVPCNHTVACITDYLQSNLGMAMIPAFFIAGNIFSFIDKFFSLLLSLVIFKLIPKRISDEIWDTHMGLDVGADNWDPSNRERVRSRLLLLLAFIALALTVAIAWISVSLYTIKSTEDRVNIAKGAAKLASRAVPADEVNDYLEHRYKFSEAPDSYRFGYSTLQAILNSTPDAVYVYVYQIREDGCYTVFDTDPLFAQSGRVGDFLAYEESYKKYIPKLLKGERVDVIENKSVYGWFLTAYEPVFDKAGNCVAYAGVDISMKNVRDYSYAFLFRIVLISSSFLILAISYGMWMASSYHRVIDKHYEMTLAAKDEADRANTAKSRFLANMSHEIRTPINTILGMDEMILREDTEGVPVKYLESVTEYAHDIQNASIHLLGLINDVLDVSKIESGKMSIVEQNYDTKQFFGSIITMFKTRTKEKDLCFETDIDPQLPSWLYGDDGKIKHVLINLLSNAIKYTDSGKVKLTVSLVGRQKNKCSVYYSVEDTGIGIEKDKLDKIFEAFERLDEDKNSSIQGTGLGLHISHQFCHILGGELLVESKEGEGSRFFFVVEQGIVDNAPIGAITDIVKKERDEYVPAFFAPEAKVLVVDDNDMNLKVIEGLLKKTGLKLTLAISGKECLEKLEKDAFNLIVLDHMMPGMDGVETLKRIREKNIQIPVIALTANVMNGGAAFYKEAGFDDYLSKPVEGKTLEETILKYLPVGLLKNYDEFEHITDEALSELDDEANKEVVEALRNIEGIKLNDGIKYCGNLDAYLKFLHSFEMGIDDKAKEIETAYEGGDYEFCTIKVHALKSTARIIGATHLSYLAEQLEKAGRGDDIQFFDEHIKELLEMYREYKDKLSAVPKKEKTLKKTPISEEELQGAYNALKEFIPKMDYDAIEMIMEDIKMYKLPEKDKEYFDKLEKLLKEVNWDEMEEMINSL
ncbi:response regulator [Butyrivibrio sp. MC2021]|uniref:response regulator n=1 Tax=Butyrivibrio sp. MC2021 TaxID=1408306 RepID=UPI0018CC1AF7|nr:response regulator [Butyrivibrio sp. MC2021]